MCVRSLTRIVEGVGHKLYMDSYFSSPDLYDDISTSGVNYFVAVRTVK
jgi:hypothetical protein